MRRLLVVASVLAVVALAIGVAASRGGGPAAAATPTPVPTSTPVPLVLTNSTGSPADSVRVSQGGLFGRTFGLVVLSSPAACGAPVLQFERYTEVPLVGANFAGHTETEYRWPSACIPPGATVTVEYTQTFFGTPPQSVTYVFFDSATATPTPTWTPSPTPTITPTPSPAPVVPVLALDCDTTTPGVQNDCTVPLGTTSLDVDIVFFPAVDVLLAGFDVKVLDPDKSRLNPPEIPATLAGWDSNPDFNQFVAGGSGFVCIGPSPDNDIGLAGPAAAVSFISCVRQTGAGIAVSASQGAVLVTMHYDVPSGAAAGQVQLSLWQSPYPSAFYSVDGMEVGSCPVVINLMECRPATIHLVAPPTATPTLTPTPVLVSGPYTFTNSGGPADTLTITNLGAYVATITVTAPGCPPLGISAGFMTFEFHWPTACVDTGESVTITADPSFGVGVQPNVHGFFFNSNVTPFTPTPTPGPPVFMSLDCNTSAPGVQDDCAVPLGTTSLDVDVVFTSISDVVIAGFNFSVRDPDKTRLNPPSISDPAPSWDSNPDFNQSLPGVSALDCGIPAPIADTGEEGPAGARSFISCASGVGGVQVAASQGTVLATVHYDIPTSASTGLVHLSLTDVALYDRDIGTCCGEVGSCPIILNELECRPATVHLVAAPVVPAVAKQPEGNAANADLSVPKANLWLCVAPASCAGNLRVVEYASNVYSDYDNDGVLDAVDPDITGTGLSNTELGLGAYEFSVEYDNFVIQSVNPCDIVFGPGGAGATRGPVDELNSSAANPDCTPDPNVATDGTCAMSLVLENVIRFGCVTNGSTPYGPSGSFALASLDLIPHPDLTNDIFPGNNNGVLTVLKDNGCELADIFGHPVAGSINGGLTQACGDLAVTVRILEGDLNLDCKVDVTDEQLISFRYGAFFGDLSYTKWHDLEPATHDLDIDIKDLQKVFGRDQSTCQAPIPAQSPADPPALFG